MQIKNGIQLLEVSKIRGKNKKNFEKCWLFIINNFIPNRLVETSGDCEWTDNIEYTRRRQTIQTHKTHTHYTAHSHMLSPIFRPTLKAPPPFSDILTTGYNSVHECNIRVIPGTHHVHNRTLYYVSLLRHYCYDFMSAIFKVLLKSVSYDVSMPTPPIFYVATFISLILARLIF